MTTTQATADAAASTADREIVLTRDLDAPRELVFAAWTDPDQIGAWWGPHGFTTTIHEMEVRPGGRWRYIMHGPDGTDYPNRVVYREVTPPERLVYDHGDDVDDDPNLFFVTVTFDDLGGGRSRVTSRMLFPTAAHREGALKFGAKELGQQTMDRLARHVGSR